MATIVPRKNDKDEVIGWQANIRRRGFNHDQCGGLPPSIGRRHPAKYANAEKVYTPAGQPQPQMRKPDDIKAKGAYAKSLHGLSK